MIDKIKEIKQKEIKNSKIIRGSMVVGVDNAMMKQKCKNNNSSNSKDMEFSRRQKTIWWKYDFTYQLVKITESTKSKGVPSIN